MPFYLRTGKSLPLSASEIREVGGVKGWFAEAFAEQLMTALRQPEEPT